MAIANREVGDDRVIIVQLDYIQKSIESLDKKIDRIEYRQWQIILLLLSYPLGLIVGKLCHIF